jgi:hypothetical protein
MRFCTTTYACVFTLVGRHFEGHFLLFFESVDVRFRPQLVELDLRSHLRVELRLFRTVFAGREMRGNVANILRTGRKLY